MSCPPSKDTRHNSVRSRVGRKQAKSKHYTDRAHCWWFCSIFEWGNLFIKEKETYTDSLSVQQHWDEQFYSQWQKKIECSTPTCLSKQTRQVIWVLCNWWKDSTTETSQNWPTPHRQTQRPAWTKDYDVTIQNQASIIHLIISVLLKWK